MTMSTVLPSAATLWMASITSVWWPMSRALVGSSSKVEIRILGQHRGKPRPLGLAAGTANWALCCQDGIELHQLPGPTHHAGVLLAPLGKPALMGMAAICTSCSTRMQGGARGRWGR